MRVLVTGATGFVGKHLLRALSGSHKIAMCDLFGSTRPFPPEELGDTESFATIVPAELTEPESLRELIRTTRPDSVIHLAGFASAAGTDAKSIIAANVDAARLLLEALTESNRPVRALLASSGYVYGDTSALGRPARETDFDASGGGDPRLSPSGIYAESKVAMEKMAREFASETLSLTATRAFNHTGPGQTDAFVVPAFAKQIAQIERGLLEPVVRVGNLDAVRDFLDVRDVVDAYSSLVLQAEPAPWRVVNIASGTGVAIRFILETLVEQANVSLSIEPDPARQRPSDLAESVGDPELLLSLTGLNRQYELTDTLTDTLNFWRARFA